MLPSIPGYFPLSYLPIARENKYLGKESRKDLGVLFEYPIYLGYIPRMKIDYRISYTEGFNRRTEDCIGIENGWKRRPWNDSVSWSERMCVMANHWGIFKCSGHYVSRGTEMDGIIGLAYIKEDSKALDDFSKDNPYLEYAKDIIYLILAKEKLNPHVRSLMEEMPKEVRIFEVERIRLGEKILWSDLCSPKLKPSLENIRIVEGNQSKLIDLWLSQSPSAEGG